MLSVVIEEKSLGHSFSFIIAGTGTYGIYAAAVAFGLRIAFRISVYLRSGCLEDTGAGPLGEAQSVKRSVNGCLGCIDRILLLPQGACRTCEIIYLVAFNKNRLYHIMSYEFKIGISQKMADIILASGKQIVHTYNIISVGYKPVAQIGSEKAGSACSLFLRILLSPYIWAITDIVI